MSTTTPAPPLPGLLYAQADEYLAALDAMESDALAAMRLAWYDTQDAVQADLDSLLDRVAEAQASGKPMSPAWAYQEQRLKALLETSEAQIARYASVGASHVKALQENALYAGTQSAGSLASAAIAQAGVTATFVQVNPENMRHLIGFLQDGTPLADLFATLAPGAAQDIQNAFVRGIIQGKGPQALRDDLTKVLDVPRWRAETIARTEAHRVFRAASRATYMANADVLEGWVWTAHLGPRACPACVAMHGTVHPVTETLDGHPRCRCAMVPRTKSWEDLGMDGLPDTRPPVQTGEAWLKAQPPKVQRAVLGKGKFEAWKAGQIELQDVVHRSTSPAWGTMRREATLAETLQAAEVRQKVQLLAEMVDEGKITFSKVKKMAAGIGPGGTTYGGTTQKAAQQYLASLRTAAARKALADTKPPAPPAVQANPEAVAHLLDDLLKGKATPADLEDLAATMASPQLTANVKAALEAYAKSDLPAPYTPSVQGLLKDLITGATKVDDLTGLAANPGVTLQMKADIKAALDQYRDYQRLKPEPKHVQALLDDLNAGKFLPDDLLDYAQTMPLQSQVNAVEAVARYKAAQAAAREAAERAAREAAEKAAQEQADRLAALKAKWEGKPPPVKPVEPPKPPTVGSRAFDSWLDDVKARYTAHAKATGSVKTDLEQSLNWSYVRRVIDDHDVSALDYLKANYYVDDALYARALQAIKDADKVLPEYAEDYAKAMRSYKNRMTRWKRYTQEWREANGLPASAARGMDDAVRHTDDWAGVEWANKTLQTATGEARQALTTYTGGSYRRWNAALRQAKGDTSRLPDEWRDLTRKADSGMIPMPESVIVNRGTGWDELEWPGGSRSANLGARNPADLVGTVQQQDGYLSASVGKGSAFGGDVSLRIMLPEGHPAAWVDPYSLNPGEREIVIGRGSRYFVHAAYKAPGYSERWVLEVEIVPESVPTTEAAKWTPTPSSTPFR